MRNQAKAERLKKPIFVSQILASNRMSILVGNIRQGLGKGFICNSSPYLLWNTLYEDMSPIGLRKKLNGQQLDRTLEAESAGKTGGVDSRWRATRAGTVRMRCKGK